MKKPEVRAYVEEDVERIVKTIAALRGTSMNAVVNEAIELWLNQPEQQATIEKHRLEEITEE
ncbi:MAG: hypothetical protein HC895_11425 [Leptolyngbyaceae cyanobacterium SM1_3_5]|nr:hypothetical protein [Leptolyngbyaceae cyanobacterium SM1_3_5]